MFDAEYRKPLSFLLFVAALLLVFIAEVICDVSCWFFVKPLAHLSIFAASIVILGKHKLRVSINIGRKVIPILVAMFIIGLAVGTIAIALRSFGLSSFILIGILGANLTGNDTLLFVRALYVLLANAFFEEYYFRKALMETLNKGFWIQVFLFTIWHLYLGLIGMLLLALPMGLILGKYYEQNKDFCGLFLAHMLVNIGLGVGYILFSIL